MLEVWFEVVCKILYFGVCLLNNYEMLRKIGKVFIDFIIDFYLIVLK